MKRGLFIGLVALCSFLHAMHAQQAAVLKARAYELYQAKQFDESARQFKAYFDTNPDDPAAMIDYAALLSELQRHDESAKVLEALRLKAPQNETAAFKLAVEYAALKRYVDAEKLFTDLQRSTNPAIVRAAAEASQRAKDDQKREDQLKAEQRVYDLANQGKHQQVIDAVGDLEEKGPLSFGMQMQRIYSLQTLRQYAMALKRADALAVAYPNEPDLMLLRADLLNQLQRRPEAEALWRQVIQKFKGTLASLEAERRLADVTPPPEEERIYELARERKHREVILEVGELEKKRPLSLHMQLQRLFAYQALGERKLALEQAKKITGSYSNTIELAFLKSDLLLQEHRFKEASAVLKSVKEQHPRDTNVIAEANKRLQALPPIHNLDKNFWGEAYVSGDYLGRFGTVVGSGFLRQGAFIPGARWLQPYVEMRFGVDTRSGIVGERTIITDNHVGLYGGVRAQLLPSEYLFVYAQVGGDIDLLEQRNNGDFSYDSQAGIYGFKSWGPGTVLLSAPPGWKPPKDHPDSFSADTPWHDKRMGELFFWRGDWFADAGADFSYYHRYSSWIGYGQARQGFRLFQFGPNVGFDAYVVENISWDVRGNYFDNLIEIGPGARILWVPHRRWEVVLRAEWLNGFYFGRGEDAFATPPESHYDEIRVGLSVGTRW